MKKIIYAIGGILIFTTACSQRAVTDAEDSTTYTETNEAEEETNEEQNKVLEDKPGETPSFVGQWSYHEPSIKLDVSLTINADGTYMQQTGKAPKVEGTWEKTSENMLVMKSPTLRKEGQKWEIKENTEDKLSICWNPDSENPKTIPFTRVK